jgi:tetratricopeptide (TPR) repeat protein
MATPSNDITKQEQAAELLHSLLQQGIALQSSGELDGAAQIYQRALKLAPRNADAHHLLGLISKSRGEMANAIEYIGHAISINPDEAVFYSNLGACYLARHETIAAELCFKKALIHKPEYADAWNNLSVVLLEQDRDSEAIEVVDKGLSFAPVHEQLMCNRAKALFGLLRFAESLDWYQRATSVNQNSTVAWFGCISCLSKLDRIDEALALTDRVSEIDPKALPNAMQARAGLLEVAGRMDEACEALDRGLAVNPGAIDLNYARARIRKVRRDEPFFGKIQEFIPHVNQATPAGRTRIGYALGKAFEDVGDMAQAAHFYGFGAQSLLQGVNFSDKDEITMASKLKSVCDRAYLERAQIQHSGSARSVLIVGMPRSGTTLTEQIIASHPAVHAGGELTWLLDIFDGYFLTPTLRIQRPTPDYVDPDWSLEQRAENYLNRLAELPGAEGKLRVTDKMPGNYTMLGLVGAMLPDAKIIHCRRDPIDTCISCYTTLFGSGHLWSYDLAALGRHFRQYWELMAHWRKVMPERILEVRYEETVADTEAMARRLLEWSGLSWDERCLDFHKTKRPVHTASVAQVRQPIYTSSMGRWKKWGPFIQPLIDEIGDLEEAYWAEIGQTVVLKS